MKVERFNNPKQYLEQVEGYLLKNEVVNNLPLGILYNLVKQTTSATTIDPLFALVKQNNKTILIMMMTAHNLILFSEEEENILNQAIDTAVDYLLDSDISIPGVIGPTNLATSFASVWSEKSQKQIHVDMKQKIYKLEQVNEIEYSPGECRVATKDDLDLLTEWIYDFGEAIPETVTREHAVNLAVRGIEEGSIYIWQDKKPVSMAKKVRPTKNGIVVNLVYTPPEFRGKGYASSCVATLSQQLLDDGYSFCSLYTDLSNPTSNKIYRQIGYNPIQDSIVYRFK